MTTELKAATAEPSPWEQATLFINGTKVEWGAELVLFRGQESEVTVEATPAIARELNLGLAGNGGLEPVASPEFGAWLAPVNGKFHWKIKPDAGKSGRISLVFFSREVVESWEHRSLVISSNLGDEADALIDGKVFPEGFIFRSGEKKSVSLRVKDGSPLAAVPLKLTYLVVEGDDLQLVSEPDFGVAQTDYQWDVTGVIGNGTFKLGVEADGMSSVLYMPDCRIMSDYEDQPLIMLFNGKPVRDSGVVVAPANSSYTVIVKHNNVRPENVSINAYECAESFPGKYVPQVVDPVEGATWQVTFTFDEAGREIPVTFWEHVNGTKRILTGFWVSPDL
jgi:hypothetical protein